MMNSNANWIPWVLTLLVLPGMGHLYLNRKWKGYLFGGLSLLIALGGLARYLSVVFALANVRPTHRPPALNPWILLAEAWRMDYPLLVGFLAALLLVWVGAAVDLGVTIREIHKQS